MHVLRQGRRLPVAYINDARIGFEHLELDRLAGILLRWRGFIVGRTQCRYRVPGRAASFSLHPSKYGERLPR